MKTNEKWTFVCFISEPDIVLNYQTTCFVSYDRFYVLNYQTTCFVSYDRFSCSMILKYSNVYFAVINKILLSVLFLTKCFAVI